MKVKRWGAVLILLLAFFGIADSAYIAQNELAGSPLICNLGNLSGCNTVAASPYARVFGIPLALFGVFFYGILFVLAAVEIALFDRFLRRVLQALAVVGIVASLYFTFLQMFVIRAFCIYCLASAVTTLLIFVCATLLEPLPKKRPASNLSVPPPPPPLPMPPRP